ncbi:hypothetical protein K450DRAFT_263107 [Umbelopsis ramanniana AG]|uniref:Uncharacterized protein n=1 Tax=Umbelopsis ramanniana AG TaxID=1314678 RepID=A0AAD5DZU5_UMBRA|nr:uncharacterized protein K450DRAFT_263107 [Umbelopsis ramanniana AG]KAI8575166.1 hypothetical protein K450DRAFT_263107 [Umbelopsis ramanniana AG]
MTELSCAQPSALRQYWQRLNDPTLELRRRRPPWSIGPNFGLLIKHGAWMAFWKADIPHQARTAWWRLLHDKSLTEFGYTADSRTSTSYQHASYANLRKKTPTIFSSTAQ